MATKKTTTTNELADLKAKLMEIRLNIKAHKEKNTNAHKAIKKQIAQLLTSSSSKQGSSPLSSRA